MPHEHHTTSMASEELTRQELPDVPVFCPSCGGQPKRTEDGERGVRSQLSALGYLHDDQVLECSECDNSWTHGIPVGTYEAPDLECDSCQHDPDLEQPQHYLVHRVVPSREATPGGAGEVTLHLKCPRCYLFKKVRRQMDHKGVALVGYGPITGSMDGADPYGWQAEEPPGQEGGAD